MMMRRMWLGATGLALLGWPLLRAVAAQPVVRLNAAQSRAFRDWFCAIVQDQAVRAPTPRWTHRDCAGLVRFAAREAFAAHDAKWFKAMGWPTTRPWPPEVQPEGAQVQLGKVWHQTDGSRDAFVSALALVQNNTRLLGKSAQAIQSGDLLFFDQGAEQHLMVWTGRSVTYHTGSDPTPDDNGLRITRLDVLMQHPDTRWRPVADNPNFAGWFRFVFLA